MRNVVASLFMSLDGVVESPDQWQFDVFDEALGAEISSQLENQDAFLLGRVSYEEWASYWPTSNDEPFATVMNTTPKYIVSMTLDNVTWGSFDTITLLKGDLVDANHRTEAAAGEEYRRGRQSDTGSVIDRKQSAG
jgi:hypothetical protein